MTLCTYEYILSKQVTLLTVSDIYKRNEIPIAARSASLLRPITHPRKPLHFPTPSRPKNGTIGLGSGCSYSSARTLDLIGLELYIHLREGPTGDRQAWGIFVLLTSTFFFFFFFFCSCATVIFVWIGWGRMLQSIESMSLCEQYTPYTPIQYPRESTATRYATVPITPSRGNWQQHGQSSHEAIYGVHTDECRSDRASEAEYTSYLGFLEILSTE